MKKKFFGTIASMTLMVCLLSFSAWSAPAPINYYGKLTDADDNVLNGDYLMSFSFYTIEAGGSAIWTEIQTVTITDGLYNVQLSAVSPFPSDLLNFNELYLELSLYNSITSLFERLSPRQSLTSTVYYAMKAGNANFIDGKGIDELLDISANTQTKAGGLIIDDKLAVGVLNSLYKFEVSPGLGSSFSVSHEGDRPVIRIADEANENPVLQFVRGGGYINLEYNGSELDVRGNLNVAGTLRLSSGGDSEFIKYPCQNLYIQNEGFCHQVIHLMPTGFYLPSQQTDLFSLFCMYDASNEPNVVHTKKIQLASTGDSFLNGGNIAIGTQIPTAKLDVRGRITVAPADGITVPDNAYKGNIVSTKPTSGAQHINIIKAGTVPWSIGTVYGKNSFAIGLGKDSDVKFNNPEFAIDINGNVGIGTTSTGAQVKLRVYEEGVSSNHWRGRIVAGGQNASVVLGEFNNKAWLGGHNAGLNLWSDLIINPDPASGNVGIGTQTPTAKLDVAGTIKAAAIEVPVVIGLNSLGLAGKLGILGHNPDGGYPAGWGGGVHTWDVYAEGGIGCGTEGSLKSYIHSNGSGYLSWRLGVGTEDTKGGLLGTSYPDNTAGIRHYTLLNNGNIRFAIGLSGSEGGSNTGSDFNIWRYNDTEGCMAGLIMNRQTGDVTFAGKIRSLDQNLTHLPTGWDGGVHTWDVYAEEAIGCGRSGQVNAYMTQDGTGYFAGTVTANKVQINNWTIEAPDYVFSETYKLPKLEKVEKYIKKNKHLPEIPSAKEMKEKGVDLAEMNMKLLKKVEELTLYVIAQQKEINKLKSKLQ